MSPNRRGPKLLVHTFWWNIVIARRLLLQTWQWTFEQRDQSGIICIDVNLLLLVKLLKISDDNLLYPWENIFHCMIFNSPNKIIHQLVKIKVKTSQNILWNVSFLTLNKSHILKYIFTRKNFTVREFKIEQKNMRSTKKRLHI